MATADPADLPRILYLVHSLPPDEHTGTPLFTFGYAHAMAIRGWAVTVAYASASAVSWDLNPVRWPDEPFDRVVVPTSLLGRDWAVGAASVAQAERLRPSRAFVGLLDRVAPDLVHVVNNVNLPLEWPELAALRGIPVVRSVTCAEDLCGMIAPVSPLSGPAGFCTAPLTPQHCSQCLRASPSAGSYNRATSSSARTQLHRALERKRARSVTQFAQVFDRIVFATPAFRHYFEQTLPLDPAKVRVIEMGMDRTPWPVRDRPDPGSTNRPDLAFGPTAASDRDSASGRPLVFALAATLDAAKGLEAVVSAFTGPDLIDRNDYRLVLMGGGDQELIAPLLAANPRVTALGFYRTEELPQLLAQADVGLSTSVFETFHRVTREYLLAGLPVIGSRAFGIPDIIRPGFNGLLFDPAQPDTLTRAVISLLRDPRFVATLTAGARSTSVRSVDEEADALAALYLEVRAESASAFTPSPQAAARTRSSKSSRDMNN